MAHVSTLTPLHFVLNEGCAPRQPGLLNRFVAAMMQARQRQMEREIANYLANCGGKFTDEAEREIERRFLSGEVRW